MTRVKVCCIASVDEARLALRCGASALGLVSAMPSGPGVIPEERIAEIAAAVPRDVHTFLLTSRTDPGAIAAQVRRAGVNTVQICDRLPHGAHAALRRALPGVRLVQVVHVTGASSVPEAVDAARDVDGLLLDSGNQALAIKELGGTGRTHDWSFSARIVRESGVPVFLAGGLNAANVASAIRAVRPHGVDLCTGVRTNGALDERKLCAFFAAIAEA
jgi:phosphoribosylanthranilate isomerase